MHFRVLYLALSSTYLSQYRILWFAPYRQHQYQAYSCSHTAHKCLESGCVCALDAGTAHGAEGAHCHDDLGTALASDLQAPHIIRGCPFAPFYHPQPFIKGHHHTSTSHQFSRGDSALSYMDGEKYACIVQGKPEAELQQLSARQSVTSCCL